MSAVSLELRLREPERSYPPRGEVRGVARVVVPEAVTCETLELSWTLDARSTHGSSTKPGRRKLALFRGAWQPGEHEYEFAFPAPRWPPTYRGALIDWSWSLELVAKLGAGVEVRTSIPAIMEVPSDEGLAVQHKNPGDPARVAGTTGVTQVWIVIAVLMSGLAALAVHAGSTGASVVTLSLAVAAGCLAVFRWQRLRHVGEPQLVIELAPEPEPALRCTMYLKPGSEVDRVECALRVYERARLSSADRKHEYAHTIFERTVQLEPDGACYRGRIELPRLPYTVEVGGFAIGWVVNSTVHHRSGVPHRVPDAVLWAIAARGAAADVS